MPELADCWEVLKKFGVSVADKLSGDTARRTQRLVLEDEEEWRVAESYAYLIALPNAVSEEALEVPVATADDLGRMVAKESRLPLKEKKKGGRKGAREENHRVYANEGT